MRIFYMIISMCILICISTGCAKEDIMNNSSIVNSQSLAELTDGNKIVKSSNIDVNVFTVLQLADMNNRSGVAPMYTLSDVQKLIDVGELRKCQGINEYYSINYADESNEMLVAFYRADNKLLTCAMLFDKIMDKKQFSELTEGQSTKRDVEKIDKEGLMLSGQYQNSHKFITLIDDSSTMHAVNDGFILITYKNDADQTIDTIKHYKEKHIAAILSQDIKNNL